jgi:hypothetical protein
MFGKEPELYYKESSKKTSWMGRIFSILFVLAYFAFFIYKLVRMLQRKDVSFYDTFTYADEPSEVKITNENFYGGFGIENPETYDTFIDESIYFPKAYFRRAEKKGDDFIWDKVELELEPCKLEKFGSIYQEKFRSKQLNNLYCIKNMDFILEGHFSYDRYSFLYFQFFPCINTTEKQNCKPLDIIDQYLKNTFVQFQWQDIELNSKNYSYPIKPRDVDIYTTVGKKLFQEIHAFFQVVKIETDLNFIGFDEFEYFKTEVYLKYDEMTIMTNLIENDIYETGDPFCDFTIKLSENVRIHKRSYITLITILGDVGGLMEVLFTLFRVITSLAVDILYEVSLVNNLFNFNLDRKTVILKDKNSKKIIIRKNDIPKIYSPQRKVRNKYCKNLNCQNNGDNLETGKRINDENNMKLSSNNENLLTIKFDRNKPRRRKSQILQVPDDTNKIFTFRKRNLNKRDEMNEYNFNIDQEYKEVNEYNINKIQFTRACVYLCFCCARRRNNMQNILLDEGMHIINEHLDIFNLFEQLYRYGKTQEKLKRRENDIIEMSDICKVKLKSLSNKLH